MNGRASLAPVPVSIRASAALPTLVALAAALIGTGLLFHTEVAAAMAIWRTSTAYSHCFLVLPVAGFLAYERRSALTDMRAAPMLPAVLPILPVAVLWLAAQRLGIMEARQLLALTIAEILAFALLGPALWRRLAVPLLYLYFLVPFGDFLTPVLQAFTVSFIDHGLDLLGIPHLVQATIIEIPAGAFRVAEACAGLRFLIASIAFGVLYACTLYRTPGRRIAFIAASIIVPIIANGVRALGIVVLGNILGDTQAAAIDHILYGWLFFSLVTLLLIAAGLSFREDQAPVAAQGIAMAQHHPPASVLRVTLAIGLMLAATGPAAALLLDNSATNAAEPVNPPALVLPAGCSREPASDPDIHVICNGLAISLRLRRYAATAAPATLLQAERSLAGPGEIVGTSQLASRMHQWLIRRTTEPVRLYAIGPWLTDDASPTGLTWRLHQAIRQLRGAPAHGWRPVIAVATVDGPVVDQDAASATLRRFLLAQGDIADAGRPIYQN